MDRVNVSLSEGQKKKLMRNKQANVRLSRNSLSGNDGIVIGKRDANKLNKARKNGTGVTLYAQAASTTPAVAGGSLFSAIMPLARAALPIAAKSLGLAGLSFGAEKALGKIFGKGMIPPKAIELGKLVDMLSPDQKKLIRGVLRQNGIIAGRGMHGGFLGLLASLGIPLAISLVKKVLGKGISLEPRAGKGMRLEPPPPIVGRWGKKNSWMYL